MFHVVNMILIDKLWVHTTNVMEQHPYVDIALWQELYNYYAHPETTQGS